MLKIHQCFEDTEIGMMNIPTNHNILKDVFFSRLEANNLGVYV